VPLFTVALLPAALVASPGRAQFHVSPAGSDANPGSATRPFRTLVRARQALRAALARGAARDLAVVLHGGAYYLEAPFALDERDSGREGQPVI